MIIIKFIGFSFEYSDIRYVVKIITRENNIASKIFIFDFLALLLGKKFINKIIPKDIGMLIRKAVSQFQYSTIKLPHKGPITPPSSAEAPINPNP